MYLTKDGSIVSDKNEILFFSIENFIENIWLGNDVLFVEQKNEAKNSMMSISYQNGFLKNTIYFIQI